MIADSNYPSDALAYWRDVYNVRDHVARCQCDDCDDMRAEIALAAS